MQKVKEQQIGGITVDETQNLIYANPETIDQNRLGSISRALGPILDQDSLVIENSLRSRPLRYVPIMHRIAPALSLKIKEAQLRSMEETSAKRAALNNPKDREKINDPLRSIALIPEHWRYYPDPTLASQLVGFLNSNQEAQYGVERTFDSELRGQEGEISTVSDPTGGQIVTSEQTIRAAKDGDTVVLTIDPFIQKFVEEKLAETVQKTNAEHAQVIVMDPKTGRILAMANAPLFSRSDYSDVFEKETMVLTPEQEGQIVIEIIDPETNIRIMQGSIRDVFDPVGRAALSEKLRQQLDSLEKLHDLHDLTRYYIYRGQTTRFEVFPTSLPHIWLKYRNNIGVGAYINRTIQEIYEPGSVMKSITMAIALDQGELTPLTTYVDSGAVIRNDFPIDNNDSKHYGLVTMTNCLEFSINTCMTSVSERLGRKLFHNALDRFGFGHVTGVELEDETTGDLTPWRNWSDAQLATTAFGQGIAVTPLQMITAYTPLANHGKLMKPIIIDRIEHADGTVDRREPQVVDQVITPQTADSITAMLVSSAELGFAKNGRPKGYTVAAKTGTSQIAGPGGKYETGTGATIASYVGYAPPTDPKFIVIVKIDRATYKSIVQGAVAAAPLFKEVSSFLFQYYGIPPDNVH
jgi:cell division protein FtsI/penicillin-binding protein 2